MRVVIQRVKQASVTIDKKLFSSINKGILVLLCIEKGDSEESLQWMVNKIVSLRMFEDENGKMNKSILDICGEMLIVSQFTLAADCKKGTRPSFDKAEEPAKAKQLYEQFVMKLQKENINVKTGVFAAMMDVNLCNDGPVTFVIEK